MSYWNLIALPAPPREIFNSTIRKKTRKKHLVIYPSHPTAFFQNRLAHTNTCWKTCTLFEILYQNQINLSSKPFPAVFRRRTRTQIIFSEDFSESKQIFLQRCLTCVLRIAALWPLPSHVRISWRSKLIPLLRDSRFSLNRKFLLLPLFCLQCLSSLETRLTPPNSRSTPVQCLRRELPSRQRLSTLEIKISWVLI